MNGLKLFIIILLIFSFYSKWNVKEMVEKDYQGKLKESSVTLFLCGDVMTGRGIDQILPHPVNPVLYEPYMKDARGYVEIAEEKNGKINLPVAFEYIWGDAIKELEYHKPDLRLINLETSITQSSDYWQGKGINYRMNPENINCITSAKIDCCILANNHVLDWGYQGLKDTLLTLKKAGIKTVGAGDNLIEAETPVILDLAEKGRVIILSYGSITSGIPYNWAASGNKPGVNLLADFSRQSVDQIKEKIKKIKSQNDIVIFSIHWGGNWGYYIPGEFQDFAHDLIDLAEVDIIHGHSSHHFKGIEVYKNRPIIYGCGDFLNDYEGIDGYEDFRDDLALMFFVTMDLITGNCTGFKLVPLQIKNFRLNKTSQKDTNWIIDTLNREGKSLRTKVIIENNSLFLTWD